MIYDHLDGIITIEISVLWTAIPFKRRRFSNRQWNKPFTIAMQKEVQEISIGKLMVNLD